jgi:CRP-like cAMP-binding protein
LFDLEILKLHSSTRKYPKNELVISEGAESPFSLYFILSGSVRVVKNYGQFSQSVVGVLERGDFFGEMSLFMKKPRTATVQTAEESVLMEITQENVYEVIRSNPKIFYEILKTLCERVDRLNSRVRSLGVS